MLMFWDFADLRVEVPVVAETDQRDLLTLKFKPINYPEKKLAEIGLAP